jgi:hypothetical protein
VLLLFMGLVRAPALLRVAAAMGFATLCILFALAGIDYATRVHPRAPTQQPQQIQSHTLQGNSR